MSDSLTIRELGDLVGDVLVFGGCYSNLAATRALFDVASDMGFTAERMICTGDTVGYCAEAAETAGLIRASGVAMIAGNVERQLAAGAGDCGCGYAEGSACARLSVGWFDHATKTVGPELRGWMNALPDIITFRQNGKRTAVVHGGATDIARFLWPSSSDSAFAEEFAALSSVCGSVDYVVASHAGIAFERVIGDVTWLNAGAVGLPPHDGRAQTRFAVLRSDGARILRLDYPAEQTAASMVSAGLTQGYEATVVTGIWPSEDVLPPELRR